MVKLGLFGNCYGLADFMFQGSEPKQVSVVVDYIDSQYRDYTLLKRIPITPDTVPRIKLLVE